MMAKQLIWLLFLRLVSMNGHLVTNKDSIRQFFDEQEVLIFLGV